MRRLESREKTRSRESGVLGESEAMTLTVLLLAIESPEVVAIASESLQFATFRHW